MHPWTFLSARRLDRPGAGYVPAAAAKAHTIPFLAAILSLSLIAAPPAAAQGNGRNILFIAVDDMRNWVGYAGDYPGTVHTPNIDALAAVSTRYLAAYASVPQCAGSRTSVMLGQSPATHGIDDWFSNYLQYNALFANPWTITLPQVMSQHGYHTAVTGKVFHSPQPGRWDESGPATILDGPNDPFQPGPDGTYIIAEVLPPTETHLDQVAANWAVDFIDTYAGGQTGSQPFFLAVGFFQPHLPWRAPQWAYDLYPLQDVIPHTPPPGDLDDEPFSARLLAAQLVIGGVPTHDLIEAQGKAAEYTRAYLAAMTHTDAMVGQLLAALAASPYAATTDVVFWSDHGFHLGEKEHWRKNSYWEPAVRAPLLVSSPGNPDYPVGDVTDPVSLLDLAPSVLDLAGLPAYPGFEGAPLHDAANRSPVEIYYRGGKATVSGGIKDIDYLLALPGPYDRGRYDLGADPQENTNLLPPPGC